MERVQGRPGVFLADASHRKHHSKAVSCGKPSVAPYCPHDKYEGVVLAWEHPTARSYWQSTSIFSQEKENPTPDSLASLADGPPAPYPQKLSVLPASAGLCGLLLTVCPQDGRFCVTKSGPHLPSVSQA